MKTILLILCVLTLVFCSCSASENAETEKWISADQCMKSLIEFFSQTPELQSFEEIPSFHSHGLWIQGLVTENQQVAVTLYRAEKNPSSNLIAYRIIVSKEIDQNYEISNSLNKRMAIAINQSAFDLPFTQQLFEGYPYYWGEHYRFFCGFNSKVAFWSLISPVPFSLSDPPTLRHEMTDHILSLSSLCEMLKIDIESIDKYELIPPDIPLEMRIVNQDVYRNYLFPLDNGSRAYVNSWSPVDSFSENDQLIYNIEITFPTEAEYHGDSLMDSYIDLYLKVASLPQDMRFILKTLYGEEFRWSNYLNALPICYTNHWEFSLLYHDQSPGCKLTYRPDIWYDDDE